MLATTDKKGNKVTCNSFTSRRRLIDLVSKEEYETVEKVLEERRKKKNILLEIYPNKDNGELHDWVSVGTEKYGRMMYCLKTKEFREQTMGEFYENSTVD